jgi:hypothetical protein
MTRDFTKESGTSTMTATKINDLTSLIALHPTTIQRMKYFEHSIGNSYDDLINHLMDKAEGKETTTEGEEYQEYEYDE